ncbi:bifunctional lysine-specific demethylase and histidyl-hydroxylase NO66-like [Haliotis rubra]|uniref:bifunctional lysine-specific demethylase and histidyl-hydroxylase NO66-like n=1 Tax=Haliotis rubra TaxID=36100 RepID=UPI001EE51E74|nr:bifunctional lysine-specific demethylase and histidyl-hydroxylase NO66-like [Haliotis rubra]
MKHNMPIALGGSTLSIDSIGSISSKTKKTSPEKTSTGKSKTSTGQLPKPMIASPAKGVSLPPKPPKQNTQAKQATKRKMSSPEHVEKKKKKMANRLMDSADTSQISGVTALPETDGNEDEEPVARRVPYMYDSGEQAKKTFECLIHPLTTDRFFSELWERKPLLVKRHIPHYNDGWFTTSELDRILREENIQFGVNLDVTTFEKGVRETHNISGRAYAPVVWDYYQNGCSVRLLNPQTYSRNVWKLLAILQEYFGCCVGANVYLTPPGTQGFAPHFDDIEAFILQLEGKKHWRLYSPRNKSEVLPRFSSANLKEEDVGEPILDVLLEAGDMLYFPRGTIHQVGQGHVLLAEEKACSIHGTGERWDKGQQRVVCTVELDPDTHIKIIRRGVIRLVTEEDQVRIYHCLENSRVYHGNEPQFIEILAEAAPAVEYLIHAYPEYIAIDSLPLDNLQDRIDIARDLYERGLLITGDPLEPLYEESEGEQS